MCGGLKRREEGSEEEAVQRVIKRGLPAPTARPKGGREIVFVGNCVEDKKTNKTRITKGSGRDLALGCKWKE